MNEKKKDNEFIERKRSKSQLLNKRGVIKELWHQVGGTRAQLEGLPGVKCTWGREWVTSEGTLARIQSG